MKIARIATAAGPHLAMVTEEGLVDLHAAALNGGLPWAAPLFDDMRRFLAAGDTALALASQLVLKAAAHAMPVSTATLLAPVETGGKLIAHVVNYAGHDKEAKVKIPAKPFFFVKTTSSLCNPGDPLFEHPVSAKLDHEIELAVVIGRPVRDATVADAMSHVAGFAVCNDVSYRDLQMNEGYPDLNTSYGKNWTQAKGLDHACPIGPWLVLRDEMPEPYPLRMTCRVNGRVRQQDDTANMIHKVVAQIVEISRGMTLMPGDVILTGTCAGGGLADGVFLRHGDEVECEIEGIGVLRNPVVRRAVAEARAA